MESAVQMKMDRNTVTMKHAEYEHMDTKGRSRGGMDWEIGIGIDYRYYI